jgi:hypothetical protein
VGKYVGNFIIIIIITNPTHCFLGMMKLLAGNILLPTPCREEAEATAAFLAGEIMTQNPLD